MWCLHIALKLKDCVNSAQQMRATATARFGLHLAACCRAIVAGIYPMSDGWVPPCYPKEEVGVQLTDAKCYRSACSHLILENRWLSIEFRSMKTLQQLKPTRS